VPFARPEAESRPANRSNEGKVDPQGRLWLGTMESNLNPDGSERAMSGRSGALYCIDGRGSSIRVVDDVGLSNTLAWADGGRTLYFGDSLTDEIGRYRLDAAEPRVIRREAFQVDHPAGVCDGSAIDAQGGLWNARFGAGIVGRFTPEGRVDRTIGLPCTNPTSCCFAGDDLRTLYVTSARFGLTAEQLATNPTEGALIALAVDIPGAAIPPFSD
jgi:sugar lactone lactonase YvrE